MKYALKVTCNNKIDIIEFPEDKDFHWYADQIGCDWIETVHPRYCEYTLIVDEEGRLKPNRTNLIASAMYGTFEHGEPIVGDCLIVDEGLVDGEPDIVGFTLEKANRIKYDLEEGLKKAKERLVYGHE